MLARQDRLSIMPQRLRFALLAACALLSLALVPQTQSQTTSPYREIAPPVANKPTPEAEKVAAELGVGCWIWTTNFADQQSIRLWRSFTIPETNEVRDAAMRITADNLYRLYLDGRRIGEGGNWRSLTEYDVTHLLSPGAHVLTVEAFSDSMEAGVLGGLRIKFADGTQRDIVTDRTWFVVPDDAKSWQKKTTAPREWHPATEVGVLGQQPWWMRPVSIIPTPPLLPVELHFWQTAWFLVIILTICALALAVSLRLGAKLAVQTRAQQMLERERARIARDIHDELGFGLTQLVLQGEVAQTEFPEGSPARLQFDHLCERARAASRALDEVVWAVNSKRDTLRDFSSYICKYAQNFLASTSIRCRLDVQTGLPVAGLDLPIRRGLLLAVKEALNNAAKHSHATELYLRVFCDKDKVVVVVEDNGRGFDPMQLSGERNGIINMQERLAEMGGECRVFSVPEGGCRIEFLMPLATHSQNGFLGWRRILGLTKKPSNS